MSFRTEKDIEWWMKPMWFAMPLPDGSKRMVQETRECWAYYTCLTDMDGYTAEEVAAYADTLSHRLKLPYETGFMMAAWCMPRKKAA